MNFSQKIELNHVKLSFKILFFTTFNKRIILYKVLIYNP